MRVIQHEAQRVVELPETFNYSLHKEFRQVYSDLLEDPAANSIEIDFQGTSYIDSAALGMLLMLRKLAEAAGKTVALINARGTVREVLEIAHFQTLFTLR